MTRLEARAWCEARLFNGYLKGRYYLKGEQLPQDEVDAWHQAQGIKLGDELDDDQRVMFKLRFG